MLHVFKCITVNHEKNSESNGSNSDTNKDNFELKKSNFSSNNSKNNCNVSDTNKENVTATNVATNSQSNQTVAAASENILYVCNRAEQKNEGTKHTSFIKKI